MRTPLRLRATNLVFAASLLSAGLFVPKAGLHAGEPPAKPSDSERSQLAQRAKQLMANAGPLLRQQRYAEGTKLLDEARAVYEQLYSNDAYPQGHLDLARCYGLLSVLSAQPGDIDRSRRYAEQAVAMYRRLYPKDKYPTGDAEFAMSLRNAGLSSAVSGNFEQAMRYFTEALAMYRSLYPRERYPQGHPEVATALDELGTAYMLQERFEDARPYHEQALAMYETLYPKAKHPGGHATVAKALNAVASDLFQLGKFEEARGYHERALTMWQALCPSATYPQGHPEIAAALYFIGSEFLEEGKHDKAQEYAERSLAMYRSLYPKEKHPNGTSDVALSLHGLSLVLRRQGKFEQAMRCSTEALAIYQKLCPEKELPNGHPALAIALGSVAADLVSNSMYDQARRYAEQSLAMCQRLYPPEKFPQGHPDLALAWSRLGNVLSGQGQQEQAGTCYEQSLAIRRHLCRKQQRPPNDFVLLLDLCAMGQLLSSQGRRAEGREYCREATELFDSILKKRKSYQEGQSLFDAHGAVGALHWSQGQFEQAQRYFQAQLGIAEVNHPSEKYPLGHRDVAASLTALGLTRCARGMYEEAIGDCQRALAIYEALYPRRAYPDGHPDMMPSLTGLGCALAGKQDFEKACPILERVAQMEQSRGHSLVIGMPEAEALSTALTRERRVDILVSVWRRTKRPLGEVCSYVWASRGLVQRVVSARQKTIQDQSSPDVRRLYDEYVAARQELARLALAPVDSVPKHMAARQERLVSLGKRKEDLERTLSERVPGLRDQLKNQSRPHTDLVQYLPADSVFADVVLYADSWIEPGVPGTTGARSIPHYLVFLLSRGEPVAGVNLGPAKPIDEAAFAWYQDISAGRPGKAVSTVRDLVWEPIKKSLPKGKRTIFICPDGALSGIPWGAIPGSEADSVLLDAYTFMFVPHGQFLLEQMTARLAERSQDGVCLAVGNVAYDEKPSTAGLSDTIVAREAILTNRQVHWPPLPGTKKEVEELEEIAPGKRLVKLTGREASTPQVLSNLPKARWAHFGTHGFLASPEVRTAMRLDEALFDWSRTLLSGQRLPIGTRNPLLMSGLVLAGANLAPSKDAFGIASGQVGILTSEAIAGLRLQNLDLAVLSACDTAMGGTVVGEGVFGLQRAFHIAGARNVIGTLWKVDDQATAALMRLFYHKLWIEGKSPIVALRESQLAIYRHPEKVADLAAIRGPEFAKVIQGVSSSERPKLQKTAPTKAWAAFILSGAGQ